MHYAPVITHTIANPALTLSKRQPAFHGQTQETAVIRNNGISRLAAMGYV